MKRLVEMVLPFAPALPPKATAAVVCLGLLVSASPTPSQAVPLGFVNTHRTRIPDSGPFDDLGFSLASDDGVLAAGAINVDGAFPSVGAVLLYDLTSGSRPEFTQRIFAPEPDQQLNQAFGWSVDIDGDTLVVGARDNRIGNGVSGAGYVFKKDGDQWGFAQRLVAEFGGAGIVFAQAGEPVVGSGIVAIPVLRGVSTGTGAVSKFEHEVTFFREQGDGSWDQITALPIQETVWGVSLEQDQAFVRTFNGTNMNITVYEYNGSQFIARSSLTPEVGELHGPFADQIATDAGRAIVSGTNDEGLDYVGIYEEDQSGAWHRAATFVSDFPGEDFTFGYELAIEGDLALASARDYGSGAYEPVVLVYARQADGVWVEVDRLVEPVIEDPGYDGLFGWSIAIEQRALYVGTGVNSPGSIYTFVAVPEPSSAVLLTAVLVLGASRRGNRS